MNATATTLTAKRYACDRCRDLKLRCSRDLAGDDSTCDRCVRVDAFCVTSSGRPLGRPPGHGHRDVDSNGLQPQYSYDRRKNGGGGGTGGRRPSSRICRTTAISNPHPQHLPTETSSTVFPEAHPHYFDAMLNMQLDDSPSHPHPHSRSQSAFPIDPLAASLNAAGFSRHGGGFSTSSQSHPQFCPDWSYCYSTGQDMSEREFSNLGHMMMGESEPAAGQGVEYQGTETHGLHKHDSDVPRVNDIMGMDYVVAGPGRGELRNSSTPRSIFNNASTPVTAAGDSGSTVPLIGVIGSISRQLAELKDLARDPCLAPIGISLFDSIAPDFGFLDTHFNVSSGSTNPILNANPMHLNPLEKTLITTMRFTLVLQMIAPLPVDWDNLMKDHCSVESRSASSSESHHSSSSLQFHSHSPSPSLSSAFTSSPIPLPTTLMLLSTYLQLGQLFDAILAPTIQCLEDSDVAAGLTASTSEASTSSESHHSSPLSVSRSRSSTTAQSLSQPRGQHILMIIRVVEHQLHSVERLMGLPAQYRLWGRKDAYEGILHQEASFMLIKAVMGHAQDTFRSLKRTVDSIQVAVRSALGGT